MKVKILMQLLWSEKTDWDDPVLTVVIVEERATLSIDPAATIRRKLVNSMQLHGMHRREPTLEWCILGWKTRIELCTLLL